MNQKSIYLHGSLADEFGPGPFKVCATTPKLITRYLTSILGVNFRKRIAAGRFHLLKNNKNDLGEEHVDLPFTAEELHFVPVVEGSSNVFRIILGLVLVVVGLYTQNYNLVYLGAGIALGGIVGLLTPMPKVSNSDYNNGPISNIFQGQQNVTTQGGPVPVVFGRWLCGSVVISAGIEAEDVPPGS